MLESETLDQIFQKARLLFERVHQDAATGKWEIHFGTAGRTALVGPFDGSPGTQGFLMELFSDDGDPLGEKFIPFEPMGDPGVDAERIADLITKEAAR